MSTPPPFDARLDGRLLALLVLSALAIQLPIYDRWVSLLDEGAIAQLADQLNHGMALYRDGVHVALPGVFYLTAALYQLFGASLLVGRGLMVVAFTLFVMLVYLLARTISGRTIAFGIGLLAVGYRVWAFPHWQMLSYSPLAILLLLAATGVLARDLRRPKIGAKWLAGGLAGLALIFKQDSGGLGVALLTFFVCLSSLARSGRPWPALREGAAFGLAGVTPLALVFAAYGFFGLAGEAFHQTVIFPLVAQPVWQEGAEIGLYTAFPPIWPPWGRADLIRGPGFFSYFPSLLLDLHWRGMLQSPLFRSTLLPELFVRGVFTLPYLLLATLTGLEVRRTWQQPADAPTPVEALRLRLLLTLGLAMILSFNRPRDWIHLLVLYGPTLILLAGFCEQLAGPSGLRRRIALGAGGLLVAAALVASLALALAARRHYDTPIDSERAGLYASEHVATVLNPLLTALATPAGQPPRLLAAFPASPTLNFLSARPLATRFLTVLPLEEFSDRDEQVRADLLRAPEADIVYALRRAAVSLRPQDYVPLSYAMLVHEHRLGAAPHGLFNGSEPAGLLMSRLEPRAAEPERLVYDFAARLDDALQARHDPGAEGSATAESGEGVHTDVWAFEAPVLVLSPPTPPALAELVYEIETPPGAQLRFAVAMDPDTWTDFMPTTLRFEVLVDGLTVFEQALDPRLRFDDRRWVEARIALSAGRHTLRFRAGASNAIGAAAPIAGFARPRIVLPGNGADR